MKNFPLAKWSSKIIYLSREQSERKRNFSQLSPPPLLLSSGILIFRRVFGIRNRRNEAFGSFAGRIFYLRLFYFILFLIRVSVAKEWKGRKMPGTKMLEKVSKNFKKRTAIWIQIRYFEVSSSWFHYSFPINSSRR